MGRTKGSGGAGSSKQEEEISVPLNRLADVMERFLGQDIRQGVQNPPIPPVNPRPGAGDSASSRFQKLKPPTFEGSTVDPKVAENWIRTI